jgi:preprotein translocase subunit SecD
MTAFRRSVVLAALCATLCLGFVDAAVAEKPPDKPAAKLEIRRAENEPAEGLTEATVPGSKEKVYLHKAAELTNADIAAARATEDTSGKPAVEVTLTKEGAQKMRELSEKQKNKPLAILVNGKLIAAPTVRAVIGEKAVIAGNFTKDDVDKLVKALTPK